MMIFVTVEEQYSKKVNGLCGNYNKNNTNDLLLPDQTFTSNTISFGNSWKVDSTVSKIYFLIWILILKKINFCS